MRKLQIVIGGVLTLALLGVSVTQGQPSSERKRLVAKRTQTPPVIDGKLDDAGWENAPRADKFTRYSQASSLHPEQTVGQVCVDDDNLYVAVQCRVDDMDYFLAQLADSGDQFSWDQAGHVEVFFDMANAGLAGSPFRQYCLHANGSVVVVLPGERGKEIQVPLKDDLTFKSLVTATGFNLEAAFPLHMMRLQTGNEGVVGFNLCRHHDPVSGTQAEDILYSTWNFVRGKGFQRPDLFGQLASDTDLSPFFWKEQIVKKPSPDDPSLQVQVTNETGKSFSGKVLADATAPDGRTKRYEQEFSCKTGESVTVVLEHPVAATDVGTIYDARIVDTVGKAYRFTRAQGFVAKAIIMDGPFFVRDSYQKNYPQYCPDEDDFIFNHSLYVSPDHVLGRGITYTHSDAQVVLPTESRNIRLIFEFPQSVEVTALCHWHGTDERNIIHPQVESFVRDGQSWRRYILDPGHIQHRPNYPSAHYMYFRTTLPAGEVTRGHYYVRWQDGQQVPEDIRVESLRVPKVKPPRKFFVGVWGLSLVNLKTLCPNFPEDFTSLGMNLVELSYYGSMKEDSEQLAKYYEFADPIYQAARKKGLFIFYNGFKPHTPEVSYGHPAYWAQKDPSARALSIDGDTIPWSHGYIVCPSYRGTYYQRGIERIKTFSQLKRYPASYFNMDVEMYGGRGAKVCFCTRCIDLFEKWFARRYPDLVYIDPVTLNREARRSLDPYGDNATVTTKYPGQYQGWVDFKIEQFADMWGGVRDALAEVVGDVRTAPFDEVVLGEWGGIYPETLGQEGAMYSPYTLKNAIGLWASGAYGPAGLLFDQTYSQGPAFYRETLKQRRCLYDTAPTSGTETGWRGSSCATKPERTKYYMLESAMNGVQGILLYPYGGLEGKQLALNAEVFGSFRLVDDLITEGRRMNDLQVTGKDMHVRGFQIGDDRLVLVGDNYVATDYQEAVLTCPVPETVGVYDLLKLEKLGELSPDRYNITLVINGLDDRARFLYIGNNWKHRLAW